ncbi:hypothetical protein [Aureibacillus halotolerans]|uniref:Uncharacterized protein n=1 Tax=Aureibacillus halotolerans TaxID=1508390 RepID=A0A4R6UBV8_9BACI|nr:hypothetical protein [Aureibacillus halotolerans]TDQ42235.1 hypothetical protein EV213_102266 [Aureibacillus halotolerans]
MSEFNYHLQQMLKHSNEMANEWEKLSEEELLLIKQAYPFNEPYPAINTKIHGWSQSLHDQTSKRPK